MKHPFQIITVDRSGKHLFASVKNHLQVFELLSGKLVGSWEDTVDILTPLKKQQGELLKKLIAKQEAEAKEEAEDPEKAEDDEAREESAKQNKKLKNNKGKPVAPKIPTPGPGAPPIYNYIRSLALSKDENFLVGTTDSDKAAVIFEVDFTNSENCLKLIKRQVFPKRPCAVSIDEDLNLIVADKFGDVYSIRIDHEDAVDEKDLTPILGHVSMLSDVLITSHQGKKFVLTGDRDEHIRVTNFPKAYVIKNWLYGHHEFVSTMHIPQFDDSLLISGGGDDYLCLWNWLENKLVGQIQLRPLLEEHLSDEHFPPTRFRDEKSLKEISINSILTMQAGSKNLLIVGSENSSVLLVFELKHDFTVELLQTLITSKPLVGVCIDCTGKRVIASIDDETDSELLQIYKFNGATLELESSPVTAAISKQNACDVESRSEFYPLYYINTLRKRSDH